jgi:hypothetical protein
MDSTASAPSPGNGSLEDVARRAIAAYRSAQAEIERLRERVASLERELEGAGHDRVVVHLEAVPDLLEAEPDLEEVRDVEFEAGLHSVEELELADEGVRLAARRRSMREIERRLGKLGTAAANR